MTNTLKFAAQGEREIVVTRDFNAPRQVIFEAWTRPELLKRWLYGPEEWGLAVCEIDLRVGGTARFIWRDAEGCDMGMSGIYREITPPERIAFTEVWDEDRTGGEVLVTLELLEQDSATMLRQTMVYSSRGARDGGLATDMEQGMAVSYDRLAKLLASLPVQDRA
jgi:uncharacterized protein YndB with AHSA1/START domain